MPLIFLVLSHHFDAELVSGCILFSIPFRLCTLVFTFQIEYGRSLRPFITHFGSKRSSYYYCAFISMLNSLQDVYSFLFTDKVIRHNPPLPVRALPSLNHDRNDHNTKPMEHWCIATVAWPSYYCMTSSLCRRIRYRLCTFLFVLDCVLFLFLSGCVWEEIGEYCRMHSRASHVDGRIDSRWH